MILTRIWQHGGLVLILLLALGIRLWLLAWWNPFPFGDVFNYVSIAQHLQHLDYPVTEKRLPFYPLLILIGHTLLPYVSWENVAIGIAMAMSLVALALLYALGRILAIQKIPLLVGLLLFMSYQPFLAYSIRGYADTTFIALLLAAIIAVLQARKQKLAILTGFLLGALALTRYEGVIAAALLGLGYIWQVPQWRQVGIMAAFASLALTPYIAIATHSGRSLLPQAYITQSNEGNQGYGASSWSEFSDNYFAIWDRLGLLAVWRVPQYLWEKAQEDLIGWHQYLVSEIIDPRKATALLALVGLAYLLWRRAWRQLLIIALPFLAISAAGAWWAPLIRYDALYFPLLIILAMGGLQALNDVLRRGLAGPWGTALYRTAGVTILIIGTAVWMLNLTQDTYYSLRKSRFRELAFYQAVKSVRNLPNVVAFDTPTAITEVYLHERALYGSKLFTGSETSEKQWQILREHDVTYIVTDDNTKGLFQFLQTPPATIHVTPVANFTVEQGNNNTNIANVYKIEFGS